MHTNHVRRGALSVIGIGIGMTLMTSTVLATTADASGPSGDRPRARAVAVPAEPVEQLPVVVVEPVGQTPVAEPATWPAGDGDGHDSDSADPPPGGPTEPVEPVEPDPPVVHAGPGPVIPGDGVTTLIDPVTIERAALAAGDETG